MKKSITTVVLVAIFSICLAAITDLNGKWGGTVKLPDGNSIQLSYNFKVDSGKLTGTAHTPHGDITITDGMINGNDFSFNVAVPDGNAPHTGKLYDDSVSMHIVYMGQHLHTTLTRVQ